MNRPAPSDLERERLQRRTIRVLLVSQVLAGAGLAAGITVGALLAEEMLGSSGSAGVPAALFTLGSAGAALIVGRISQSSGRRRGLAFGYAVGAIGGAGVVLAAALDSVPLLFVALVLYGAGTATNLQARYAGGDLVPKARRGRAMSTVLVATTLGAVAGPNLVDASGALADGLGIATLAGPFILATAAYAVASAVIHIFLRPDPLLSARRLDAQDRLDADGARVPQDEARNPRMVVLAGAAMVLTQVVMIAIMTMTPVHMHQHGHGFGASGVVISVHVAAMFLPSPLAGHLVDRRGPAAVLGGAGGVLLAAAVVSAAAPADSAAMLALGLGLLGFGWCLGLAAGSAMVTEAVPLRDRARVQGQVDVGIAVAGAAGGLSSGYVMGASSFAILSLIGGVLALLLLPIMARARMARIPQPSGSGG